MREDHFIGRRASALARMLSSKLAQNPESWGFDRAELRAAIRRDIVSWAKLLDSNRPLCGSNRVDPASLGRLRVRQRQIISRRQERASSAKEERATSINKRVMFYETISAAHMQRCTNDLTEVIFEAGGVENGLNIDETRCYTKWLRLRANFPTELSAALQHTKNALQQWPPPTASELSDQPPTTSSTSSSDCDATEIDQPQKISEDPKYPPFNLSGRDLLDEAYVKDAVYTLAHPSKWSNLNRTKARFPTDTATYNATKTLRKPDGPDRDQPSGVDFLHNHRSMTSARKTAVITESRIPLTGRHLMTMYLTAPHTAAGLPPSRDRYNTTGNVIPEHPPITNNLNPWWITNDDQDPLWTGVWFGVAGMRDNNQLDKCARLGKTCLADLCRGDGISSGPLCISCVANTLRESPKSVKPIRLPLALAYAPPQLRDPQAQTNHTPTTVYECHDLRRRWIKYRIHSEVCDLVDELELYRSARTTRPSVRSDLVKQLSLKDGARPMRIRYRKFYQDCVCARLPPHWQGYILPPSLGFKARGPNKGAENENGLFCVRVQGLFTRTVDALDRWRDVSTALLHVARVESKPDLSISEGRTLPTRDLRAKHKKPALYILPACTVKRAFKLHRCPESWEPDSRLLFEDRNRTIQTMMASMVRQDPLLRQWFPRPNTLVIGRPTSACRSADATRSYTGGFARGTIYEVPKNKDVRQLVREQRAKMQREGPGVYEEDNCDSPPCRMHLESLRTDRVDLFIQMPEEEASHLISLCRLMFQSVNLWARQMLARLGSLDLSSVEKAIASAWKQLGVQHEGCDCSVAYLTLDEPDKSSANQFIPGSERHPMEVAPPVSRMYAEIMPAGFDALYHRMGDLFGEGMKVLWHLALDHSPSVDVEASSIKEAAHLIWSSKADLGVTEFQITPGTLTVEQGRLDAFASAWSECLLDASLT